MKELPKNSAPITFMSNLSAKGRPMHVEYTTDAAIGTNVKLHLNVLVSPIESISKYRARLPMMARITIRVV